MMSKKEKEQFDKHRVTYREGGSLKIFGEFELLMPDGTLVQKDFASFCRCGLSRQMPFCDGEHREQGWVEPEQNVSTQENE